MPPCSTALTCASSFWDAPFTIKAAAFSGDGRTLIELGDDQRTVRLRSVSSTGIRTLGQFADVRDIRSRREPGREPSRPCRARPHRPQKRQDGAVLRDLRAGLEDDEPPGVLAFSADATGILALAGYSYPVTGTVDLHLQVSGTRLRPARGRHMQLRDGSIYGEPVERFSSDLSFNGEEVELKNIQLAHYESKVTGGATYNRSSHAYRFQPDREQF